MEGEPDGPVDDAAELAITVLRVEADDAPLITVDDVLDELEVGIAASKA